MLVRKLSGTVVAEDDDYLLKDGESLRVPTVFMDARQRAITDALGGEAGLRPGLVVGTSQHDAERERAYEQRDKELGEAWKKATPQQASTTRQWDRQHAVGSREAVEAAYEAHDRAVADAWKTGSVT